jgi:methenyltetrahydrofolate cyclohydrolase
MTLMDETTLTDWMSQLAARQPTPGGGAVAALATALSAALIGMVSSYTTGPKWADQADRMRTIHDTAEQLRAEALGLMQADAEAFAQVGRAYGLLKESEAEKSGRTTAIQAALLGAAEPPRQIITLTGQLLPLLSELAEHGNPNVISDVAVGASMAQAALESAVVNIDINRSLITDRSVTDKLAVDTQTATELIKKAAAISKQVQQGIRNQ